MMWSLVAWMIAFGSAPAEAAWRVESPAYKGKATAEEHAGRVRAKGFDACEVVRRFTAGTGWRWYVRIDGLEDERLVQAAGAVLGAGDRGALVYSDADGTWMLTETLSPAAPAAPLVAPTASVKPADDVAPSGRLPSAAQVLRAAQKAHGGRSSAAKAVLEAPALRFEFSRRVGEGTAQVSANNVYERQGLARRLEVRIQEGPGQASRTVIDAGNHAWVDIKGTPVARDAARTREVVERFSPEEVLSLGLNLADRIDNAPEWDRLDQVAQAGGIGAPQWRLTAAHAAGGAGGGGLVEASFDAGTRTLRSATWEGPQGLLRVGFSDYRPLGEHGLVAHRIEVWRDDKILEAVEVKSLELLAAIPKGRFDP